MKHACTPVDAANLTPLQAPLCPLCGQPNGCAAAAAGCFDVACWCTAVTFHPALLAGVPPASQGKACICRHCAEGSHGDRTVQGTPG